MFAPPRAAPQDALRGAAAPGDAVGLGDGAAQEAFGFDAVGAAQLAFVVVGAGAGAGGAGDGAPQDALGLGFGGGGFGGAGAGAGALGAGAAGALGAGASTFFSFRRMNAACFTIFARLTRPAAGLLQQARPGLNLAVQPAGPTPAARKARALGTRLLLPPYWPGGCNDLSCGLDHAVFWERSMKFDSAIHTSN